MKLIIETTEQHDATLIEMRESALRGHGNDKLTVEEFAAQEIIGHLDTLAKAREAVATQAKREELLSALSVMSSDELDAVKAAISGHGPWVMSNVPPVRIALPNVYFDSLRLPRLAELKHSTSRTARYGPVCLGGVGGVRS